MVKKRKYQFGGSDSTSFFNQLADSYIDSYTQNQEQESYVADEEVAADEEIDYDQEYEDLQQRYSDLEIEHNNLLNQQTNLYNPDKKWDDEFLNFLFDNDKNGPVVFDNSPTEEVSFGSVNYQEAVQNSKSNVSFKPGVGGLKPKAQSIVDGLSDLVGDLTVTSGLRSASENTKVGGAKKSYHLTGDAVDLRPTPGLDNFLTSPAGRKYMEQQGYEIIDERNRKGHGAHWHLEPKYQFGGVASTPEQQFEGLNNDAYDEMYFPLEGLNTFRGLDNGEPVLITDQLGNQQILHNNKQTAYMWGGVHETRL